MPNPQPLIPNPQSPILRLMRLHQPVGIWLLLWPCWWSLALHAEGFPLFTYLAFAIGAVLMRSAGCIINDMADRKFDAQVERTKMRPLASGEISMRQAGILLVFLLLLSAGIAFYLGKATFLGALASLPLVVSYPFMKRITWWPQLFLGFTFNWGALLGSIAITGTISPQALLLYAGGIFWTLGYDTIYAHQDSKDDIAAGVKSTALRLHTKTKFFVGVFYSIACICWVLAAHNLPHPAFAYFFLAATFAHMAWQIITVNLEHSPSCKKIFCSNAWLGMLPFFGFFMANS